MFNEVYNYPVIRWVIEGQFLFFVIPFPCVLMNIVATHVKSSTLCGLKVRILVALLESTLRLRRAQTSPSWRTHPPPQLTVLSSAGWWPLTLKT